MLGVFFVCVGDICRSPVAQGVFCVDSAGTGNRHAGSPEREVPVPYSGGSEGLIREIRSKHHLGGRRG